MKRYELIEPAEMVPASDGDWVSWADVSDLVQTLQFLAKYWEAARTPTGRCAEDLRCLLKEEELL